MYDTASMRKRELERLLRIVAAHEGAHAYALYEAEKSQRLYDGMVAEVEAAMGAEAAGAARADLDQFKRQRAQEVA
jgi:hypothetical protein